MAVTPVGNRPQAPANLEAPNAAAQKPAVAEASATATATANAPAARNEIQAQRQVDAFEAAPAARDAVLLGTPANDQAVGVADAQLANQAQRVQDAMLAGDPQLAQDAALDELAAPELTPDQEVALEEQAAEVATEVAEAVQTLVEDVPVEQKFTEVMDALTSVMELMQGFLNPASLDGVDQGIDQAVAQNPLTKPDPLDARGGGPGGPGLAPPDRNPLGIPGAGGEGTQPGAFDVVAINQHDPNLNGDNNDYRFGQTNCAPTAMAQVARGRSLQDPEYSLTWNENGQQQTKRVADMTNEELVSALGKIGDTDDKGTSPNGVIDMANAMGLNVDESEVKFDKNFKEGQTTPGNSFDEGWLRDQLAQGKEVIVNGAFDGKDEKGKDAKVGHYVTVAGVNEDGTFAIVDPLDAKVKNVTAEQLAEFMQGNPHNGGVMLAIG